MTDEEFIKKYEELLDKGYCDCNEMNCIDNDVPRKILNIVKGTKLEAKQLLEENQELKKQLKEYEHHLKISKEMLDLQRQDGNYNYDNYMLGLYNGMEYIMSLFEVREPIFKDGKNIKFLNDKNHQKEFIEWLEANLEALEMCDRELILTNNKKEIKAYKEVLLKYKELIGDNNVKDIA